MGDPFCTWCLVMWLEDTTVASISLARPLNVVAAWQLDAPLTTGIVFRELLSGSYRRQATDALQRILHNISPSLGVCALGPDGRIKACMFLAVRADGDEHGGHPCKTCTHRGCGNALSIDRGSLGRSSRRA